MPIFAPPPNRIGYDKILSFMYIIILFIYVNYILLYPFIEYGHEAKPSILGEQIVFLAACRDDHYGGYCRARQKLEL